MISFGADIIVTYRFTIGMDRCICVSSVEVMVEEQIFKDQ